MLDDFDEMELTMPCLIMLRVRGDGVAQASQDLLHTHVDKWAKDEAMFTAMAEEWFKTRGYTVELLPAKHCPWYLRPLVRLLIWVVRNRYGQYGMDVFAEKGGVVMNPRTDYHDDMEIITVYDDEEYLIEYEVHMRFNVGDNAYVLLEPLHNDDAAPPLIMRWYEGNAYQIETPDEFMLALRVCEEIEARMSGSTTEEE